MQEDLVREIPRKAQVLEVDLDGLPGTCCYGLSHEFPRGSDCTLSHLRLARPSSVTHTLPVSETLPYAAISHLGSRLRIVHCSILYLVT